jgi:predicted transcriptional regulator YheO
VKSVKKLDTSMIAPPSAETRLIVSALSQLVAPLQAFLPETSEVVVHDLTRLPNTVAAIAGQITGRQVGDPATDVLLAQLRGAQQGRQAIRYKTVLPNGHEGRSTTIIVRSDAGLAVAAFCINVDVSVWISVRSLIDGMVEEVLSSPVDGELEDYDGDLDDGEAFVQSVDELAERLISLSMAEVGVPVALMKKVHKMQVVQILDERGMFLLRDGIERAASALEVSRYTIYNYLNELDADGHGEPESETPVSPLPMHP